MIKSYQNMMFGFKIRQPAEKKGVQETIADYKMEILVKQGGDQFKKLIEKGINIPVALL